MAMGSFLPSFEPPLRDRWRDAKDHTEGFRNWRREVVSAAVAGVLAYLALRIWATGQTAVQELLVVVAAILGTSVFMPLAELAWNFSRAPLRIARLERDVRTAQAAALRFEIEELEVRRDTREAREWLRDELAGRIQDGGILMTAGQSLKAEEDVAAWVKDVHDYFEDATDWIQDNLGFADCIRFRDLHTPGPGNPWSTEPLNHDHFEHLENLHRRLHNLRAILADYPPVND